MYNNETKILLSACKRASRCMPQTLESVTLFRPIFNETYGCIQY